MTSARPSGPRKTARREDAALSLTLAVVEASKSPVLLLDGALRVIAASRSFGHAFQIQVAPADRPLFTAMGAGEWDVPEARLLLTAIAAGDPDARSYEFDLVRNGCACRRLAIQAEQLTYVDLEHVRILVAIADVTDVRADQARAAALQHENALLLREARHRIANSLQVIASVLLIAAHRSQSTEARGHLDGAYHRVMSVAALERQLASDSSAEVDLKSYMSALCDSIASSMIADPDLISLRIYVDPVVLDANICTCLGLIVTELIINALKHAFPDNRRGTLTVTFDSQGGDWVLSVADSGVGMPDEPPITPGLGTGIVEALAKQLGASVEISDGSPGTTVTVRRDERRG